ncbi:MAG: hypothetical protein EZS28_026993, partial [Streblomastix strix]
MNNGYSSRFKKLAGKIQEKVKENDNEFDDQFDSDDEQHDFNNDDLLVQKEKRPRNEELQIIPPKLVKLDENGRFRQLYSQQSIRESTAIIDKVRMRFVHVPPDQFTHLTVLVSLVAPLKLNQSSKDPPVFQEVRLLCPDCQKNGRNLPPIDQQFEDKLSDSWVGKQYGQSQLKFSPQQQKSTSQPQITDSFSSSGDIAQIHKIILLLMMNNRRKVLAEQGIVENIKPSLNTLRSIKEPINVETVIRMLLNQWNENRQSFVTEQLEQNIAQRKQELKVYEQHQGINNDELQLQKSKRIMQKLEQDLTELSTAIQPTVSGINPVLLDPRLIACALNRIRAIAQITGDCKILEAMGLTKKRQAEIISCSPLIYDEIVDNLAFLTFLSTQRINGLYKSIIFFFNQCFHGSKLFELPLPLPIQLFAPAIYEQSPTEDLFLAIRTRQANPEFSHLINPLIFKIADVVECSNEEI